MTSGKVSTRTISDLLKHTKPEGECLVWQRYCLYNGYGRVGYRGKVWYAHRLAYVLSGRELVPNLIVRHSCDNRPCINPRHLEGGTQADNVRDMIDRGRRARKRTQKLDPPDAIEMRNLREAGATWPDIAPRYGVTAKHLSRWYASVGREYLAAVGGRDADKVARPWEMGLDKPLSNPDNGTDVTDIKENK